MRRFKLFSAFIFVALILFLMKFPVIIDKSNYNGNTGFDDLTKGEKFTLGKKLKLKIDESCKLVYIINDRNDVSDDFKFEKVFTTTDKTLIGEFLTTEFVYTGSDMATVQNEILLYQNDRLIFRTYIVAEGENEGLQSSDFGWIKYKDGKQVSKILNEFKNNYSPIIFLK